MSKKKVIIIGGGASGFFCAANLDTSKVEVTILEKTSKLLSKVKISGGGRCNVTNAKYEEISAFANQYPRGKNLLKKTLHHFSYKDTIQWFAERNVPIVAEEDGRMFPTTNSSQTIIDCLLQAIESKGIQVKLSQAVRSIEMAEGQGHVVHTNTDTYQADYVILATGAFPKKLQYELYLKSTIEIVDPVPSLFTFNLPKHPIVNLMGLSVPKVAVKIQGSKLETEGPILITHWGLSGPVILRLSAWGARELAEKDWNFDIRVNWLSDIQEQTLRESMNELRASQGNKAIYQKNPFGLPSRLWQYLLEEMAMPEHFTWSTITSKFQNKLIQQLTNYHFSVHGKTTFKEEFVTAGGVQLQEVHSKNLMHKRLPNIFIIGEALDVDGITGGFNFQHAWSSAWIVSQYINSEK